MSALPPGRICPKCQASNFASDVHCFNCGANLEDETTLPLPDKPDLPAAADPLDFPPGARFAGRYLIVEEIGGGATGRVFKARDTKLDQTVALKMIRPERAASPEALGFFKKETSLARSLSQENIIRVYDLGESEGVTYLTMECVAGQSLDQLLRASGPLTETAAVSIARQVCRALAAAHKKGIVHRDLKPQNILLDADGRVRVADFGLARSFELPSGKAPGRIVGTPAYMPPEQAAGSEADGRSDIYSLGVILYEMLTGRRPFAAGSAAELLEKHLHEKPKPLRTWNPGLSHRLEQTVLQCLEKDPARRPPTAGRLLQSLEERGKPAPAARRAARLVLPLGAAALLLAALGLFLVVTRKPARPPAPGTFPSVAVMYFENNTGDPSLDYLRKGLCYQVIQSLLQSARLRVITTDRMFAILRDKGLLKNETYSTDDLKHVAERAQARYILQGSFAKIGRVYKINSFLLDAETWETAGSTQAEVEDLSQLNAAVERMTPAVKASLHSPGGPAAASSSGGLDRITTRSPEALKNFIEGETLFFEGKFAESAEAYRNAIGLDGDFALAYRGLAAASLYQSKRAEAKANLEKALALAAAGRASPRDRHLIEGLYDAVFRSSFPDEAVHQYRQVLSISPDDEEGLRHLGSLYRNLEEWSKARDCWERLLALDKFNPFLYINLSTIYLAEGLPEKAVDILPEDPALLPPALRRQQVGLIDLCRGRYEDALAAVNQALEQESGQTTALLLRGNIRQLQGDAAAAREDYLRIIRDADAASQALGLRFLAALCLQEGRFDEFRSRVAQGLDISRRGAMQDEEDSFLLMEAAGFQLRDNLAAAEESARRAVRLAEELNDVIVRAEGLGLLGHVLLARGNAAGAGETAERLRLLTETSGLRHLRKHYFRLKGAIARQAGDYASAADLGRMAVAGLPFPYSLNDDHAVYYESLALTAETAGDTDRAIGIRRDIGALTSGRLLFGDIHGRNYYRLGKLYLRKNLKAEAADAFDTFLRLWARADAGRPEIADAREELAALKIPGPRPASKTVPAP